MKFISITGPRDDIDRVVNEYLSRYEIHLENALTELAGMRNLDPYIQANPYREPLSRASELCNLLDDPDTAPERQLSVDEAVRLTTSLYDDYTAIDRELMKINEERNRLEQAEKAIAPFRSFQYSLPTLREFEFIRYRFGRIRRNHYKRYINYIYANADTYFCPCSEDDHYIWGAYFCPRSKLKKIDAFYTSMHFETMELPAEYTGTPDEAFLEIEEKLSRITASADLQYQKKKQLIAEHRESLVAAKNVLSDYSSNFDVRRLAACTRDDEEIFYILCGWMTEKDAEAFQNDIRSDDNVYSFAEKHTAKDGQLPPTKLKNPRIFRPYEMYIRMYGLPAYNEFDPTIFVAISYAFIFGAMFGDIGQGLCLFIGGLLLYKFKHMDLAAIISAAGIFSVVFGALYGSVFGFELENPLWLKPKEHMSTMPFIGTLNTVFVVAIGFGMILIIVTMVLHIINGVRAGEAADILFDHNAAAGLIFYGALTAVIFLYMSGHKLPATGVLVIMFVIPLLLILFKEPLTELVTKQKASLGNSVGMFFVQGFFELFEVLLSYFSNTLSFVRIGAFAVSHAAMMEVVMTLAGAENGGTGNLLVIILGNIFVCGLEGLIVGIQVLRLEYYELFSRFYKGNGREFKPFIEKQTNRK